MSVQKITIGRKWGSGWDESGDMTKMQKKYARKYANGKFEKVKNPVSL